MLRSCLFMGSTRSGSYIKGVKSPQTQAPPKENWRYHGTNTWHYNQSRVNRSLAFTQPLLDGAGTHKLPSRLQRAQWDKGIKSTRIIARNHYSQIPPRKLLYPGVKSTQNGPSWAIMSYFWLLTIMFGFWRESRLSLTARHEGTKADFSLALQHPCRLESASVIWPLCHEPQLQTSWGGTRKPPRLVQQLSKIAKSNDKCGK